MKKVKEILIVVIILIFISNISFAHGGNITGWKDRNSPYITEYNGKHYGYHKQNGTIHYHQVKWDDNEQKWIIILPAVYYDENFNKIENIDNNDTVKIEVKLVSVVDGDTAKFIMDGKTITVRFLGINTKETVHPEIGEEPFGKEGSNFTKEKLENANKIELEFDSSADKKDKYDRYLAWIWMDGVLLQNLLVEKGLAETYMLQNNYKYAGILQESEEIAKNNKLGIWSEDNNNSVSNTNQNLSLENTETNYLIIWIITIGLLLIMSIIAHNNRKSK